MTRMLDIINDVRQKFPTDTFFNEFELQYNIDPLFREWHSSYENVLAQLDDTSWTILKNKAIRHYKDHRSGQLKTGFYSQLNETFAYCYLLDQGYQNVEFLIEDGIKKPDIKYSNSGEIYFCEVKSIGISEDEINGRASGKARCLPYANLSERFMRKLRDDIAKAQRQILSIGVNGLVFVYIQTDDASGVYVSRYRDQLKTIVSQNSNILLKFQFANQPHVSCQF